jgi:hypothetical protein
VQPLLVGDVGGQVGLERRRSSEDGEPVCAGVEAGAECDELDDPGIQGCMAERQVASVPIFAGLRRPVEYSAASETAASAARSRVALR